METQLMQFNSIQSLETFKVLRDHEWAKILETANWPQYILNGTYDRRFYAIYLIETYHYVVHNPKHQALVATRFEKMPVQYNKFCYEHAEEEAGHEMMAYHDLVNLGITPEEFEMPKPLPATEIFIAYLYRISSVGNILRRLGYSFWAEDSYQYIQSLMSAVSTKLDLSNKHTTFLVSHATIDEDHAQEIEEMVSKFCVSNDDWDAVVEVLKVTLKLQSDMLDQVVIEYQKLVSGELSKYSFLKP